MELLCRTGWHRRTSESPIWNNGYWFSRCERCGRDMVRRGGGPWHGTPRGYKVVWKPMVRGQVDWNGLIAMRPNRPVPTALPITPAPAVEPEAATNSP